MTPDGMLLVQSNPGNSDLIKAVLFGLLFAIFGALAMVSATSGKWDARIFGVLAGMWGTSTAAAHAFFLKRRVRRGALLVSPWPIRLGQEIDAKFRVTLRDSSRVQHVKASLQCMEETIHKAGRDRVTNHETVFSCELPSQPHPSGQRVVSAEWKTRVPDMLPPSVAIPDNAIRWMIVASTCAEDEWVPLYFDLLVLPEIVSD